MVERVVEWPPGLVVQIDVALFAAFVADMQPADPRTDVGGASCNQATSVTRHPDQ